MGACDYDRRTLLEAVSLAPFAKVSEVLRRLRRSALRNRRSSNQAKGPELLSLRARGSFATRLSRRAISRTVLWSCVTVSSSVRAETTWCSKATRPHTRNCWLCAMLRGAYGRGTYLIATCTPRQRRVRCVRARSIGGASAACSTRAALRLVPRRGWDVSARWIFSTNPRFPCDPGATDEASACGSKPLRK